MEALVPTVNEEQALELVELGFVHVDANAETLGDLERLAASLPQDVPVVVRADDADLARRVTLALGRAGIDALDAGTLLLSVEPLRGVA
jgi:predicted dinucleotide-binding enzyme